MLKKVIMVPLTVALLIAAIMAGSAAYAAPPENFTGKMVMMGTGIAIEFARMGEKMRTESPGIKGLAGIILPGASKNISLYIPNKLYYEYPIDPNDEPSIHNPDVVIEKKKLAEETIDGHPCIKSEAVYYVKDKPEKKNKAVIWEATDLSGLIIRYEIKMSDLKKPVAPGSKDLVVVTEIKDIKIGAATASMFEVPKDYKKVNSMQELMAGAISSINIPQKDKARKDNSTKPERLRPPMQKQEDDYEAH
ncbi:MAG: hypothetical protein HQL01_14040 [Nitrospirae bacterium]|nr:hypothetical protein [Nitrospirota bacterium]